VPWHGRFAGPVSRQSAGDSARTSCRSSPTACARRLSVALGANLRSRRRLPLGRGPLDARAAVPAVGYESHDLAAPGCPGACSFGVRPTTPPPASAAGALAPRGAAARPGAPCLPDSTATDRPDRVGRARRAQDAVRKSARIAAMGAPRATRPAARLGYRSRRSGGCAAARRRFRGRADRPGRLGKDLQGVRRPPIRTIDRASANCWPSLSRPTTRCKSRF
jgi:hypothetical protein